MATIKKGRIDIYFRPKNHTKDSDVSFFEDLKTINKSKILGYIELDHCYCSDNHPYFNPNTGDLTGLSPVAAEWAEEKGYLPVTGIWDNEDGRFSYKNNLRGQLYRSYIRFID